MEVLLMQLFNGISMSSILVMAALGLTITFGLMGIINMAHGEFIMIGAYTTYVVQNLFRSLAPAALFDLYAVVALVLSFVVAALIGLLLERTIIHRLYGRMADSLLVTWGVSIFLQQLARSIFGAPNVAVDAPSFLEGSLRVTDMIVLPYKRLAILLIAVLCLVGTGILMYRTRIGRNVRGVMQNRSMAACMGVSTRVLDAGTFAYGCGLAGLAGCVLTWIGSIGPALGDSYIVDTFMTVVVGGVGTILGTVLGGIFIGVGGTVLEYLTSASMGKVFIFLGVIILLQFRPRGLNSVQSRDLED